MRRLDLIFCVHVVLALVSLSSAPSAPLLSGPDPQAGYVHSSWGTEKGLPQSSVTSIVQTRDGFLWLGTLGGLARFDGINFTVYDTTNTPALKSSRIRALYEDSEGNLWIGTEHGGVTRYRNGVFRWFSEADGLPSNVVISFTGDGHSGLFAGTTDGPAKFEGDRFARLRTASPLPHDTLFSLCRDHTGTLWAGTEGSGLIQIRGKNVVRYKTSKAFPLDSIAALAEDRAGNLWIGTKEGLLRLRDGQFSSVKPEDGHILGAVLALHRDPAGSLWIGAYGGLFRLEEGRLTLFNPAAGGGDNLVRAIFTDREGSLWTGTEAEGLQQWKQTNVRSFSARQGLTDHPTASLLQDRDNTVWIGSLGGGLFRYRRGSFGKVDGFSRSPASIAEDTSANIWLGDWDRGLLVLKAGRLTKLEVPGLDGKFIRSEYVDSRGALWIGTDHRGLYKYENGRFTNYQKRDGLLGDTVVYICQDNGGTLWLGFPEGISSFDGAKFSNYVSPDLLLVRTIHEDANGALWVGTYGYGLFRLRAGRFSRITTKDGLFDPVVSCILPDRHGNFWMSGNRGIFRCSWQELNDFVEGRRTDVHCVSYGVQDGLQTSETNGVGEPAGLEAQDRKLWFPMVKGVAVIDPDGSLPPAPPVVIEQVRLDQKPLPGGTSVRIQPGTKSLQVDYGALSFLRPEQVRFKYQLGGLDHRWIDGGNRRTVVYQDLAPGSYEFRVIADNGYGVWNTDGASLAVSVVPPFWRTTWFTALVLLLITAIGGLLHQFRLSRLRKAHLLQENFSRLLIESQERERQRIASELHDGLGQSLLIIKNRAFLAMRSLEDREIAAEQLEEISFTASDAVDEVRAIAYDLLPYRLDRFGLTKALLGMCLQASESSGIHFHTDFDPIDGLFPKEAERSIFRVVQEAVSNIIKYSQAERAELAVKRQRLEVLITVKDEGRGFSTISESNNGHGFGLIGMAERIRMLGGTYSLNSGPGEGTTISIRLPARGDA